MDLETFTIKYLASLTLIALASISTAHAQAADKHGRSGTPSTAVHVSGAVKAPTDFSVVALRQMTGQDTGAMPVVCASGATVATVKNFRGVRLIDVLDRVGIDTQGHKDGRSMVVIARATDGYAVTFSWNELFNTDIGDGVLVAYEKDGKPLEASEGQLLLVSGKDIKTGPRRVRWLSDIDVKRED